MLFLRHDTGRRLNIMSYDIFRAAFSIFFIQALLFDVSFCAVKEPSLIKASIYSSTLKATSYAKWLHDLGYQDQEVYSLAVSPSLGCPFVEVNFAGIRTSLMLDTGSAHGFQITNKAPSIPYHIEERTEELNADGSHRGESSVIRVDSIDILGKLFKDVRGSFTDWQMYSSAPFEGAVGLDFFLDRRLTLDYFSKKIAVSIKPLPARIDHERYLVLDLVDPPKAQGHILYVHAKVNGRKSIIYFDTGYNLSWIDPGFVDGLQQVERPGKYRIFRQKVPVEIGGCNLLLNDLREDSIRRGAGFDSPVSLTLGSDFLSNFIVTIDLRAKKIILARVE
jgi:hypothetical protein